MTSSFAPKPWRVADVTFIAFAISAASQATLPANFIESLRAEKEVAP